MRPLLLCLCALLPLAAVDVGQIPAQARWVVELRVDQLLASPLGDLIRERAEHPELRRKLAAAQALTGMDLLADLRSISVAGASDRREDAAVYVHGDFDAERLVLLAQAAAGYASQDYGDLTIHRWLDENSGEHAYGCVVAEGTLVLGASADTLKTVIDTVRDRVASLPDDGAFADLDSTAGVLVLGASQGLRQLGGVHPNARMLQHVDSARLAVRVDGDALHGEVTLLAIDADTAAQIKGVLDGLKALALLNLGPDAAPGARELLLAARADLDGAAVRVSAELPLDRVLAALAKRFDQVPAEPQER